MQIEKEYLTMQQRFVWLWFLFDPFVVAVC